MRKQFIAFSIVMFAFVLMACGNKYERTEIQEVETTSKKQINDDIYLEEEKEEHNIEEYDISLESEENRIEYMPMEVHYIDVGEADSTLIVCGKEAALIDAGNPDQGTKVRLYLQKHEIKRLKYLILTHSDRDHIGGAASVISNVDIGELFMCQYEKDNDTYNNLINEIKYRNMIWSTPEVGDELSLGDAIITVIAPNKEYDNPNDSSISFVIRHGKNSFIFTGDAEANAESDIINNGLDISADVYYVGHHGSSTSTTQEFLDKVSPQYAVISCGKENEYGHPHKDTMEKLKAKNVELYRTDEQGTIIVESDGYELKFNVNPSTNWESGEEVTFILNTNSWKYHLPSCKGVSDISTKNKMEVCLSEKEVVELGYEACKICLP